MRVDRDLLARVASVARLRLTDEEISRLTPELVEILSTFEKIKEVDTEGVLPSFHPIKIRNRLRDDTPGQSLSVQDALRCSSQNQGNYFKGPKAV